jgi:hypothetical protein
LNPRLCSICHIGTLRATALNNDALINYTKSQLNIR